MIDKGLGIGSTSDWITSTYTVLRGLLSGPHHTFHIISSPLTGREVGIMLNRNGVNCWGLQALGETLMVSVRLSQARQAQFLLEREGVVVGNPLPEQTRQRPKRQQSGGMFSVFDIFER